MTAKLNLLILEDSELDAELELAALHAAGYQCRWRRVQTREEFAASLDRPDFDLVLSDYNLPAFDGLSALAMLRERLPDIPFILVSGALGEERAIDSLKAGATDYVMKHRLERLAPVVARALSEHQAIAERKAAQHALHEAHRRLRDVSARLLQIEETERRRIARELHDEIGQILTAVKLKLGTLNNAGPAVPAQTAKTAECIATIDHALAQVRRIARDLRPSQLDDLGLVAALRSHLDQQAALGGFAPVFDHAGVPDALAPEIENTCFRVLQEALTNIARHARASEVRVSLRGSGGKLQLEVRDDGKGFDVAAAYSKAVSGKSMGLLGMRERAALAGGELKLESTPGGRTVLSLVLPAGNVEAKKDAA